MKRPTPYKEAFPAGTEVRIADREFLDDFVATWKYHHKLQSEQLAYAGRVTKVEGVSFYHGGDPLYKLVGLPGCGTSNVYGLSERLSLRNPNGKNRTLTTDLSLSAEVLLSPFSPAFVSLGFLAAARALPLRLSP